MSMVYVKTRKGRVALYNGKPISHDKFVAIAVNGTTRRLYEFWDDVEVQDATPPDRPARPDKPSGPPLRPSTGPVQPELTPHGPVTAVPPKPMN